MIPAIHPPSDRLPSNRKDGTIKECATFVDGFENLPDGRSDQKRPEAIVSLLFFDVLVK